MEAESRVRELLSHPNLVYAGLVALIIADVLIARSTGILRLHEEPLPLHQVRGWNASAAEFPLPQGQDHSNSLVYPRRRS
jgi:hypothetical protein